MYSFICALGEKLIEKNKSWRHWGYPIAILAVAIATILKLLLNPIFGVESPFLLYFAAVMFSSLYGGWQAGTLATILSALISSYLFLNPTYTLEFDSFGQILRLGVFISEGLLISYMVSKLKSVTQRLRLNQKTLSESEELYRLLVDVVQDYAIFMLDSNGCVVSWNKGAERLKGYRADEIIGQHFSRFYPQEDIEHGFLESALQAAATRGRVETEGWHIRKDGSHFWANVLLTALRDEAGNLKGFSNVTRDVTAIKEYGAERDRLITELQLERSRLETILEQMPVGVSMAEAATGKLIFGNQEMERIFGHSFIPAENIEQYQQYKTFHSDGRPYQPQETVLARTITHGEVIKDEEITILRGDGTSGTILANSTPLYNGQGQIEAGVVAFLDISERKQVQEQLANLNTILEERVQERTAQLEQARNEAQITLNHLNSIIESTNDIIGALDLEFRFTAFNTAYKREFTKVFGVEPELGMSVLDAVAHLPLEQAKVRETWGRALQGDSYKTVEDFGDPNLERNYYEINFSAIKDANNQLVGASQIVRNVSDRIRNEEQIRNLNQELEQRVIERTQALETEIQERIKIAANLRESEEKFRATFNQAAVGIAHLSIDGHFQLVNQKLCDITGYTQAELLELTFRDITYPDDLAPELENIRQILANEIQTYSMEKRYIRKDGSIIWVNLTESLVREESASTALNQEFCEPKYLIGILEDISDRKRSEEKLAAKNREITNILDSITDGFASLDRDWRYTFVNPKAEEILGKQKNELLGNNIWEVFPEAVSLPGYNYCYQAVNEQITIKYEEFHPFLNKWLDVRLYPSAEGVTLYFQDITERKKAEIALRLSEAKFRRLADANVVGIMVANYMGEITEANDAFLQMLGYTQSDLDAGEVNWRNISTAEYFPEDEQKWQELQQTGKVYFEKEYLHKNGSPVPVLIAAAKLEGNEDAAICMIIDLTERKKAELALQESEQRLSLFVRYAPVSVAMFDRNMSYIAVSQRWVDTYNLGSIEAVIGHSHYEILPNIPERWRQIHQRSLTGVIEKCDEDRLIMLDGSLQWLKWEVHPWRIGTEVGGILIFVENITDRKQAEDALRQSEQRFRNLADSMPQIVWTANPDGTVDYYNQRILEFSGFSQQADGTWIWQPVLHSNDEQRTVGAWQQAVKTGEIYESEHRIKRANGEFRWYLSRGIPVKDEQGRVIKWYGTATDIHAQKQYQAEREELLRREQAARTEAESASRLKDEFLATLSHELRTPMNAMLGWTTMLRTRHLNETTVARALETIERNTKTLNQLIEDILDVSRIIRGKVRLTLQPLQLLSVIEQAIETIKPTATVKDIQVVLEPLQANSLKVMADSSRLQQIVWNLLSNAIKFTPNGGSVTIRLSAVMAQEGEPAEKGKYRSCPIFNSHYAQIQVTDTGIGIAPEFLPFVFDRFRQADGSITRSHGGLGLGLAIVRHLVELHGGTVDVSSLGVGQGATFTVNLPLVLDSSAQEQGDRGEDGISSDSDYSLLKDLRVLVVDDEPDARDLVSVILEDRGAKVTPVGSAQEAFTTVIHKSPLDIIVSDIGMPEGDGYSLIRQIRKLPKEAGGQIPAIALTAYASVEDCNKALSAGFNCHIPKPVDPTELAMAIAHIVDRHPSEQKLEGRRKER